jgi:glycosyltransferase involved in cell wall biosynthesis/uncharacterized SAM-binding protein YcdF (DUF218 family)
MRLCVFPNDSLGAYVTKGEIKERYFNPCDLFDAIHVITLADRDVNPAAVQEVAGSARLFIHPTGAISLGTLPRLAAYRERVLRLLETIRPDVIRAYNPLFAGWLAVSCAKALQVPSVVSIHGNYDKDVRRLYWLEGRLLHFLKYSLFAFTMEPYVLRGANKVICAYGFPAEYVRRYGAKDVTVIYNRVDLDRFAPVSKNGGSGVLEILTVGRLDPEKNHGCLIQSLAGTAGLRLRIIGDGKEYAPLNRLVHRLKLEDRVEFIRSVPHREIHRDYQRADVFAIATRYGGIHIPVLEAMAQGLPVVVPKPRWEREPELVSGSALVVENTPAAFRQGFLRLRDDPALRLTLGASARQRIMPFGGSAMEAQERQVYEEVLAHVPGQAVKVRLAGARATASLRAPRTTALKRWLIGGLLAAVVATFSPTFMYLAKPLVVASLLTRADAIVVLGGGVEKDGRPTRSTLERTRYGVALYRQGLAPTIILSTGLAKYFNEARLMSEIARAEGVPEQALILEEDSRNTHENLQSVQRILDAHRWETAIVVSSPYHMRRIALVSNKCCSGTTLLYAPANTDALYQYRNFLHRFRQARAVYREYLGLGWYWIRGYL